MAKSKEPVQPKGAVWEKQQCFCREYLIDFNGADAAKRAGYSAKTKAALSVIASRLLSYGYVQDYLNELRKEVATSSKLTRELLEQELYNLITFRIGQVFDVDGGLMLPDEMDDKTQSAIASIEISGPTRRNPNITTLIKPHSKTAAMQIAMKLKGWEAPTQMEHIVTDAEAINKAVKKLDPATAKAIQENLLKKFIR